MLRKLFTKSLFYFVTLVIGKLLTAVFFLFLANLLLPEKFGAITYFLTVVQLVSTIFDLGLKQFFQKKMATDAHAWLFTQVVYLRLLLFILSFLILALLTFIFPNSLPPLGWLTLSLLVEALFSIADAHYLSIGQSIKLGYKLIVRNLLLFFYLVVVRYVPLLLYYLINTQIAPPLYNINFFYFFYTFVTLLVLIFYFPYRQLHFTELNISPSKMKHLLKRTTNYALMDSSSVVYSKGDSLVVQNILGDTALGIYGSAYRFLDAFNLLPQALFHNLFTISAQENAISKAQLKKLILTMGTIGLLVGGGLILVSEPLIHILMNENYSAVIPILRIFGVVIFLFFLNSPLSILIQSSNLLKKYLPWLIGLVILNIILTIIFILIFKDLKTAAYVKILTEILTILVNIHFIKKLKLR